MARVRLCRRRRRGSATSAPGPRSDDTRCARSRRLRRSHPSVGAGCREGRFRRTKCFARGTGGVRHGREVETTGESAAAASAAAAAAESGRAGPVGAGRAPGVRGEAGHTPAGTEGDLAGLPGARAARGGGVRGLGRRRQGRHHPPAGLAARPARLQGVADRRTASGGTGAALPVPLLAPPALPRPARGVRPLLVRPRAGGARRGLRRRSGMAPRLRGDQRLRAAARRRRHPAGEDLPAHQPGGAAQALPRASARSPEALEAVPGGPAQPGALGRLRGRHRGDVQPHLHGGPPVAPGAGQRQEVRPPRGTRPGGEAPGGGAWTWNRTISTPNSPATRTRFSGCYRIAPAPTDRPALSTDKLRPTWRHRHPGVRRHPAAAGRAGPAPRRRTCSNSTRQPSGTGPARPPALAPPP